MTARVLLDLDHAGEVREQLDGSSEVVEVVQCPWGVFGDELDIVPGPGLADQLRNRWPCAEQVCADARLALLEQFAQTVLTHGCS